MLSKPAIVISRPRAELPGLLVPPYPGSKGQGIYETVSQKAWQEWQSLQTMLINEKQLNMMDPDARKYLQEEMDKFLDNKTLGVCFCCDFFDIN